MTQQKGGVKVMPIDKGWSIDSGDWEALEQALPRTSVWREVLLTRNDESGVPARPGVYAICAQPPNATVRYARPLFQSLMTPLYIGQSETNIRSRFVAHCSKPGPKLERAKQCYADGALHFWFVEMPANTVKNAEALLIKCFGPPVNERAGTITGTFRPPVNA